MVSIMSSMFCSLYIPRKDILNDSFSPQKGTYTAFNGATYNVTSGNMAIAGGNGTFSRAIQIENIVTNTNDWYYSITYQPTNTSMGQYGVILAMTTINPYNTSNLYLGATYFSANNTTKLYLMYNSGAQLMLGINVTVTTSDIAHNFKKL